MKKTKAQVWWIKSNPLILNWYYFLCPHQKVSFYVARWFFVEKERKKNSALIFLEKANDLVLNCYYFFVSFKKYVLFVADWLLKNEQKNKNPKYNFKRVNQSSRSKLVLFFFFYASAKKKATFYVVSEFEKRNKKIQSIIFTSKTNPLILNWHWFFLFCLLKTTF